MCLDAINSVLGKNLFKNLPNEGNVCLTENGDGHRALGVVVEYNDTSSFVRVGEKSTWFPNTKLIPVVQVNEFQAEH